MSKLPTLFNLFFIGKITDVIISSPNCILNLCIANKAIVYILNSSGQLLLICFQPIELKCKARIIWDSLLSTDWARYLTNNKSIKSFYPCGTLKILFATAKYDFSLLTLEFFERQDWKQVTVRSKIFMEAVQILHLVSHQGSILSMKLDEYSFELHQDHLNICVREVDNRDKREIFVL